MFCLLFLKIYLFFTKLSRTNFDILFLVFFFKFILNYFEHSSKNFFEKFFKLFKAFYDGFFVELHLMGFYFKSNELNSN